MKLNFDQVKELTSGWSRKQLIEELVRLQNRIESLEACLDDLFGLPDCFVEDDEAAEGGCTWER